jgi:FkbM family methyltransferase
MTDLLLQRANKAIADERANEAIADGKRHLIFDIGMHDGQDAAFYMHKGFRVVAVEANPHLCSLASVRFSDAIKSGQLTILNVAIDYAEGERDFYVNLYDDHWSSLYPELGKRADKFTTIKVKTLRFDTLIAEYGVPHYLKVDIEGGDLTVLRQLANVSEKPRFISVEENGLECFPLLWAFGYRGFKLVNQGVVQNLKYPGWKFQPGTSGPFGNEAPGQWLPFGDAITAYMLNVRDCRNKELFLENWDWYDIHATLDEPELPVDFPYPKRRPPSLRALARKAKRLFKPRRRTYKSARPISFG